MRLLATSDIHLGRIPALPRQHGTLRGNSAWNAVVRTAIDMQVNALLLIGDVVEQENDFFEAYGALLKGLEELKAANIRVIAVAGNHDARVFPRITGESDAISILGRDGRWQSAEIDAGGQHLTLVGWSFPGARHKANPLASFDSSLVTGKDPCLGMLHCDLDVAGGSDYAPVGSTDLQRLPVNFWLLGHIHGGGQRAGNKALYCGSPYALDSSETGSHGAWLLEVKAGVIAPPSFVPLSPHRFEDVTVSLQDAATQEQAQDRLIKAVQAKAASLDATGWKGDLYCKITLEGRTSIDTAILRTMQNEAADLDRQFNNVRAMVCSSWSWDVRPAIDLAGLAMEPGPRGRLAGLLLALDGDGSPELAALLEKCHKVHKASYTSGAFNYLSESSMTDENARNLLRRSMIRLLEPMLRETDK